MPEFPFAQVNESETGGAVPASTTATTLTAAGTTNVKGSYVELIASTARDANWIIVKCGNVSASANFLVDIAIGSATEQIIIPDLYIQARGAGCSYAPYLFPIFIPRGSRLSARCQCSSASQTLNIEIILLSGMQLSGGSPPSLVSAYGGVSLSIGTTIDPGGTAHTDSAWTQLTAATDRQHHWLVVGARWGDASIGATTSWMLDIGVGSATEQEIISDLWVSADTTADVSYSQVVCLPYFLPASTRIVARARSSSVSAGDRVVFVKLYGA